MCFSPEVDVVVGTAISVIAIDALRHCPNRQTLPLALIPTAFALHTFESALVWCGFRDLIPHALSDAAEWAYLLFAFAVLPIYIPFAILMIEPAGIRRQALYIIQGLGLVGGMAYAFALIQGEGSAAACNLYIDYDIAGVHPIAGLIYPVATIGAVLLSSHRPMFMWGVSNVFVTTFLFFWNQHGLASLWCFYAAATSVFIAWFVRQLPRSVSL